MFDEGFTVIGEKKTERERKKKQSEAFVNTCTHTESTHNATNGTKVICDESLQ